MARDETELLQHASRFTHRVAAHAMMLAELRFARQQRPYRIRAVADLAADLLGKREITRLADVRGRGQISPRAIPPSTSIDWQFT